MLLLRLWGFHSPTPCDCGCATVESGWHLDQVQAAVCLVPAHFSPASSDGLCGDGGMDKHHHSCPSWDIAQPFSGICGLACVGSPSLQSGCSSCSPRCAMQNCAALCCDVPGCAMPCHVLQAGRGATQTFWQKGPDPAPAGEAPACAWALLHSAAEEQLSLGND